MKNYVKIIALLLSLVSVISLGVGCKVDDGGEKESLASDTPDNTPEATPEETSEGTPEETPVATPTETEKEEEPEPLKSDFEIYQSNTVCATGHNIMLNSTTGAPEVHTFRGAFKIQEFGEFEYKLYFSNNVDGSSQGFTNYPDMPTASYKIHSACFMTTTDKKGMKDLSDKIPITFNGQASRDVAPKEMFWSDAVTVNVEEGEFLVFEWTVEYTKIPATIVASTYFTSELRSGSSRPSMCSVAPLPDLIGCNRNNIRLAFLGDSITEGTGSPAYTYEFWVSQITDKIGTGYSVWNLGLDSGRANDVVRGTSWKEKVKNTDILSICIGINDVMSIYGGSPQTAASASASDIVSSIKKIISIAENNGAEIIIFSVPPFNLTGNNLTKWQTVNKELKKLADTKGYKFFDFAAVLGDPDDPAKCIYGDHPNGEGCKAVAEAFEKAGILEYRE